MASNDSPTSSFTTRAGFSEGPVARRIEQQTAKIPSDVWLWAAGGAILASLIFQLNRKESTASFIGHWAPTLLTLGIYNKLVKLHGSDGQEREAAY
jgi:hypothetical protein